MASTDLRRAMTLTLVAAVAVVASSLECTSLQQRAQRHVVTIEGMRFQPEDLTVAQGDTVVWVNRDLVPHTATAQAEGLDSKIIPANESWEYTAAAKGDFPYICALPPTMKAMLHVQ